MYFFKGGQYWKFNPEGRVSTFFFTKMTTVQILTRPFLTKTTRKNELKKKTFFRQRQQIKVNWNLCHVSFLCFYWRIQPPVRSVYPRAVSNWDLPDNVKAAVKWTNGYTWVFHVSTEDVGSGKWVSHERATFIHSFFLI